MAVGAVGSAGNFKRMTALILGATSDIAVALSRHLGSLGYALQLAGRDIEALNAIKCDIQIRYNVPVTIHEFNSLNFEGHESFYRTIIEKPDLVILVFGYLGSHMNAISNWVECEKILNTNYVGAVSILNIIANDFENRKSGVIVGISSVAGDRGRMSNYLYGSAKAGLTVYLSGLRNRLFHAGVHVLTVKPGFVRTQMTEGLRLPAPITAEPNQVATAIYHAVKRRKNTVYILSIWRLIMCIIRTIPDSIFKKLKL
jgi:decaprenylphospho-beta-D-erythro-pentofuranosid-2-ulose 2-reductase